MKLILGYIYSLAALNYNTILYAFKDVIKLYDNLVSYYYLLLNPVVTT